MELERFGDWQTRKDVMLTRYIDDYLLFSTDKHVVRKVKMFTLIITADKTFTRNVQKKKWSGTTSY